MSGISSCQPEEFVLDDISYAFVTHSSTTINVNEEISFGDGSRGVVSRLWTFPQGVADILGAEDDVNSEEKIVHAKFKVPGSHLVRLQTAFKNSQVTLDTLIEVRVLEHVKASIRSTPEAVDGRIAIKAGETVSFGSASTGAPSFYSWSFEGGNPGNSSDENILVRYDQAGTFDVRLIAYRNAPASRDTLYLSEFVTVTQ